MREPSCLELIPTPDPEATPSPTAEATPDPAPALEAMLPDEVLGYRTEKTSLSAPTGDLGFFFGIFQGVLACTGTTQSDLSLAVAVGEGLRNWSVIAVEIDGVTGEEIQDIWMFRLSPSGPQLFTEEEIDGRRYLLSDVGWATYATNDTFFVVMNLSFGDDFSGPNDPTPEPIPDAEAIVEAFIRQLPAD